MSVDQDLTENLLLLVPTQTVPLAITQIPGLPPVQYALPDPIRVKKPPAAVRVVRPAIIPIVLDRQPVRFATMALIPLEDLLLVLSAQLELLRKHTANQFVRPAPVVNMHPVTHLPVTLAVLVRTRLQRLVTVPLAQPASSPPLRVKVSAARVLLVNTPRRDQLSVPVVPLGSTPPPAHPCVRTAPTALLQLPRERQSVTVVPAGST